MVSQRHPCRDPLNIGTLAIIKVRLWDNIKANDTRDWSDRTRRVLPGLSLIGSKN